MTLLRYQTDGGTEKEIVVTEGEIDRNFTDQNMARVFVKRDRIDEANITRGQTEMYVVDDESVASNNARFGGLLRDIDRQGGVTQVIIDSFEQYARDAPPTVGDDVWENVNDDTIINDALTNVGQISPGTISNLESGLSMVFSYATQARKIRQVAEATAGELVYKPDKSVDYVDAIGSDRSGSITLSPSQQNIVGDFRAEKKGSGKNITHLRAIGVGEGAHQLVVNYVPDDDANSYENKYTYTSNNWTSGDRQIWDIVSNKDITDPDVLAKFAEKRIKDINSDGYVDAATTVKGIDVNLGDIFHVVHPEEQVDTDMRVVSLTEKIASTGVEYEIVLSTRRISRIDQSAEDRQDTQRYNHAFEGTPVTLNTGGGRQPVNDLHNYEFSFYYPGEVQYEHRVKLFVKGLTYRAYSQGAAAGGDHSHNVEVYHPSHEHIIDELPNHTHDIDDVPNHTHDIDDVPNHTHDIDSIPDHDHPINIDVTAEDNTEFSGTTFEFSNITTENASGSWQTIATGFADFDTSWTGAIVMGRNLNDQTLDPTLRYHNDSTGYYFPDFDGHTVNLDPGSTATWFFIDPTNTNGDTWELDFIEDGGTDWEFSYMLFGVGQHTHNLSDSTTLYNNNAATSTETSNNNNASTSTETSQNNNASTTTESSGNNNATTTTETSSSELGTTVSESSNASGDHTHQADPGIIQFNELPSNCDVIVNGSSIGTSLGDGTGPFEEVVDLAGELNPGQINTIEISSDTLGHIQAHLDIDVYRQILGNG